MRLNLIIKHLFSFIFFCFLGVNAFAQDTYSISGTVKNAKGEVVPAATVFIAGSEKATPTDAGGHFKFSNLIPGTYQLVVNMLGYATAKQNVILKDAPQSIDVSLNEKQIMLNEVFVGDKDQRKKYIKIFIEKFMGESSNAKYCKILNPDLLEFSTSKGVLKATTSDFLIIENNALGYRIKYLLKGFSYEDARNITAYDGDFSFEQMTGTAEQQQKWDKKRLEAYQGSLMHYLRSLYAGIARQEGFLVYKILSPGFPLFIESVPVVAEQLTKRNEDKLITFRSNKRFYVLYDKKKAARSDPNFNRQIMLDDIDPYGSVFNTDARIDSRGSYSDYEVLLLQGFWGHKRVADQLPWEYMPPVTAIVAK